MSNVLTRSVLKLNKLWQAIDTTIVETAFMDLCRGAVMGIDNTTMEAIGWDAWIKLPIRDGDEAIQTVRGPVRVPTVILCVSYEGRKQKRPRLSNKGIRDRDHGICQITGEPAPDGNIDHDIPVSRGGKNTWQNMRWIKRDLNARKGNKTLAEMGWRPIRPAEEPKPLWPEQAIEPRHPDWVRWLKPRKVLQR